MPQISVLRSPSSSDINTSDFHFTRERERERERDLIKPTMVARTPPKLYYPNPRKMVVPLDPILLHQTLHKVDKCMERLQELQYTVTGGNKVVSGITLSPRSTRGYLRTSLRCKQESLRIKNGNSRRSPGKLPISTVDWRQMSLPAMLLGETVGEILQASQFAKEIAEVAAPKKTNTVKNHQVSYDNDPKTPLPMRRITNQRRQSPEKPELRVRRKREKQMALQTTTPSLQRARSCIDFKVSSPPLKNGGNFEKENGYKHYMAANRVSPRHRPWSKKTVLFPNPLFHTSPKSKQHEFSRTKSPVFTKKHQTPHKFLIKSPVKIRSPTLSISPVRAVALRKLSPKMSTAAKIRRSFSPSRLANRFVSPLKSRKSVQKSDGGMMKSADGMRMMMSGLKQRPNSTSMKCSASRI
ncbi:hypothetical protein Leryth_023961 [Lithospermum erythrorhizon]|nr:hypothetical protein Leryth_023961 [Lithospermum erythrorhizon]